MNGAYFFCIWSVLFLCAVSWGTAGVYGTYSNQTFPKDKHFDDPNTCAQCHALQFNEWEGSIHHYSAQSPVMHGLDTFSQKNNIPLGPKGPRDPNGRKDGAGQPIDPLVIPVAIYKGGTVTQHPLNNFCSQCHSPNSVFGENFKVINRKVPGEPALNTYTSVGIHGISCVTCHSMNGRDYINVPAAGRNNNGVGNNSFGMQASFDPVTQTAQYFGPNPPEDQLVLPNTPHSKGFGKLQSAPTDERKFFVTSQICKTCHEVNFIPVSPAAMPYAFPTKETLKRVGKGTFLNGMTGQPTEFVTYDGKPFRHEQSLVVEYDESPYAKGTAYKQLARFYPRNQIKHLENKVVHCQDCHMSAYGRDQITPPGIYEEAVVATGGRKRKHAYHGFTAVSVPLVADFPNRDNPAKDEVYGHPKGTEQRRTLLLRKAITLTTDETPTRIPMGSATLPIKLTLENTGTGHNFPSGFSQERETPIEITVTDDSGEVVYRSGYLKPSAHTRTGKVYEDGRLSDLEELKYNIDPARGLQLAVPKLGPDFNLRPFANVGLVNFRNKFLQYTPKAPEVFTEIFVQFPAVNMDNTRSLKPFEPVSVQYDVPLQAFYKKKPNYDGSFRVSVKARYRTFPKKFLTLLAKSSQLANNIIPKNLVNEDTMALNSVVDVAKANFVVETDRAKDAKAEKACPQPKNPIGDQAMAYSKNNRCWVFHYGASSYSAAQSACQKLGAEKWGCELPTYQQYLTLGLDEYEAQNIDNKEVLYREYWTKDVPKGVTDNNTKLTYRFLSGGDVPKFGSGNSALTSTDQKYFQCICDKKN